MSKVFVIDQNKRPLDPIHSAQARQLLRNKKAAVYRQFPFTIILKESRPDSLMSALRLKIDPGAKFTGIALVNDSSGEVVFAAELKHRGFVNAFTLMMVTRMQFKPKKLGIAQLSPDLFVLTHKRASAVDGNACIKQLAFNHEMFRNSPSIPEPARWGGSVVDGFPGIKRLPSALPTCSDWRPVTKLSTVLVGVSWRFR